MNIRLTTPLILLCSILLTGCAAGGLTIPINDPEPSRQVYSGQAKNDFDKLKFVDTRPAAEQVSFSTWIVPMNFTSKGQVLDPMFFVAENTTRELVARGIKLQRTTAESPFVVKVSKFNIENYRVSGFSPMVTLTMLTADVETPGGHKRITAYVKRAKVPVWSFEELYAPCYNEPMDLVIKELAAKINREVYGLKISDDAVDKLLAKIDAESATNPLSYFDVYQLGFGNNQRAVAGLVKLTSSPHEYVRLAAISSLGIIGARDQQGLLESLYNGIGVDMWQDKALALKAIGDLGTAESKKFLEEEFNRLNGIESKGAIWTRKIISLYLPENTAGRVVENKQQEGTPAPVTRAGKKAPSNEAAVRTDSAGSVSAVTSVKPHPGASDILNPSNR